MNVVRLSAVRTGRLELSGPQVHSEVRRIKSTKNLKDPIGNRTRDLPAFSAVPQPTVVPRTLPPQFISMLFNAEATY